MLGPVTIAIHPPLPRVSREIAIVSDKGLARFFQRCLDHRMAPALDPEAQGSVDQGPCPTTLDREFSKRRGDVDLGQAAPKPRRRSPSATQA